MVEVPGVVECKKCGNYQFFREVRVVTHERPFATGDGDIEYGGEENFSAPVVLRILCGFCGAVVHSNDIPEPVVQDAASYRDAEMLFRRPARHTHGEDELPPGV